MYLQWIALQWHYYMLCASTIGFSIQLLQNVRKTPVRYDKINIMSDLYAGLRGGEKGNNLKKVTKRKVKPAAICIF